ncbi:peptidyl-prolyl cis-trans isomerase B [Candidatus Kinetoplastibacterium blastocrithidii TCC012E]|uniref:Peptidyl-prolyl cis-trans isomerase n=1 Tax=Candidatus Kinetoplastidibacterium blastocrithidiae TCC012E TaxID=1208922 RepID=M1M354_9PROT|nr:peptidylprolyl isomerase [Candidatus Kinetoplastibacterium blastocrithidii]AFZ83507.1 peptidyl-prolyl cis-trans isomerase B [Candidatus Kinetoplastibacterium blastocrithidii (ex Strigomonas culicis)]AGF49604.1 peptidyl-prolyl cis-trans isomerase B [Candidatus Kinetoplastibacterium blastocrithidii TCC012E]
MCRAKIQTNYGIIVILLDKEKAPKTVENFLKYIDKKFYNGTIFHRVIKGFMIQGGGLLPSMTNKENLESSIENEADNGLKNNIYTIAMARTNDPHSATSQFFINTADNQFLNYKSPTSNGWGYAVFGKVVEGSEIVDKINNIKTSNKGFYNDVPVDDVVIENIEIVS